ncbi:scarecrow 14 [Olea europaea subsp. europaea]|uniref:Scarecrow 14 n=1 Tax=Olea europaea subsp. europaea TaxID=158383 RepID=A0A8S0UZ00_OLEEU|nr:scarecrow 14 [Olea europaea subsp. europaea]
MDPGVSEMHNMINGFGSDDETLLHGFEQSHGQVNGYKYDVSLDPNIAAIPFLTFSQGLENFTPSFSGSYEVESPDDQDSDPVLKYLNQILIEENMDDKPSMFHDPLALQAAEKSLYEVLGQKYPPSPHQKSDYFNCSTESRDTFFGSSSENTNSSTNGTNSIDPQWIVDPGEFHSSVEQSQLLDTASKSATKTSSQLSFGSVNSFNDNINIQMSSFENTSLIPNIFSDSESILQFKRGMEEASKFLPPSNQLIIDLDKYTLPPKSDETTHTVTVKVEKDEIDHLTNGSKGRKHHHPEDDDSENVERSSKQSAVHVEDVELPEMFDKVLLFADVKCEPMHCNVDAKLPGGEEKNLLQTVLPNGSNGGRTRAKKHENNSEVVDLRTLLISCAQSVAADDRRAESVQLQQIRQHASPTGDAYQRLAYVFAYGLEARFSGTGTQIYASLASKNITAVEKLKAYQVYLSACPFKQISIIFANKMIMKAASEATTLHIVDFGILYGFQWPSLIQHLSRRPGGPPKLRITGIEFPQPGFRPAERVEETGCRLAKYCERFGVPFEYQAIATQNWETIKIEDLKIAHGEVLAVNCLYRFGRLLDETVEVDCPRDAVLNLIRKMNPNIFVHAVGSGSYSAPFFITRFREALFYYSALFDMLDTTLPRDDPHRMNFEQEFYGREIINVIACEGAGRVERPETHKQWQIRTMRAGFKPLPLNHEFMKKLRNKVKAGYHKDFLFDEDGNWMLQGWKGRIIYGSSCWVPA